MSNKATLAKPFPYSLPKEQIKILLLEGISDTAVNILKSAGYTKIERLTKALDGQALRDKLEGVRLLGIRSVRTRLTWMPAGTWGSLSSTHLFQIHARSPS
jgi:D-3-phosphoglycerate dehydrogenase / 2-oxoglutarate reductase